MVVQGTVYIRADGSIDPSSSPISTNDNITYTLTGNISSNNDGIVVERNDTIVDGNGFTLQGSGNGTGFFLSGVSNVTVRNVVIMNFFTGIYLNFSSDNTLSGNNVSSRFGIYLYSSFSDVVHNNSFTAGQGTGIVLESSPSNILFDNNVANNPGGILLLSSSNNVLSGNNISANIDGFRLESSSVGNRIFHNNFLNNNWQTDNEFNWTNIWDNGLEGNYWSDYNGTDLDQDGIGDTPYEIGANNTDHYPLMGTFQSFNVFVWNQNQTRYQEVEIVSNSTVQSVELTFWLTSDNQYLKAGRWYLWLFNIRGEEGTTGFCRTMIPNDVLNTTDYLAVTSKLTALNAIKLPASNSTYTFLYLTYQNPIYSVYVTIPEFPSFLVFFLLMIVTLLAIIVYKRRRQT